MVVYVIVLLKYIVNVVLIFRKISGFVVESVFRFGGLYFNLVVLFSNLSIILMLFSFLMSFLRLLLNIL